MAETLTFPYSVNRDFAPDSRPRPFLPVLMRYRHHTVRALALVDSGADLNVMPYSMGIALGAIWEKQKEFLVLEGLLSTIDSRLLYADLTVGTLSAVRMGFAWAQSDALDLILGQTSFFKHFDVCFYRSLNRFQIALHTV